ncbi:pyridoxamine 5'-phosphate oxidase family protein [Streptomyces sp. NPDC060205]|uniref:pyridoxamine 5'-phosphate oxidase family protein n=1 Tax=Streptomyces sp. NPDC060205 TaxID=3347072 RepID=UPI00364C535F
MTVSRTQGIPDPYRARRGLTPEVERVLRRRTNATIGSVNPDGTPHLARVWFLWDDNRVYFEGSSATRKARNIAANGLASVLVKGQAADGSTLVVLGQGTGRLLTGDEAGRVCARIRGKYLTAEGMAPVSRYLDGIDDAVGELTPGRWATWSLRSMKAAIRALPEYGDDDTWDRWFLPESE